MKIALSFCLCRAREVYSVIFTESSPEGNSESGGEVRGKSNLADAYARKLVREIRNAVDNKG